jgi:hypothetical protein
VRWSSSKDADGADRMEDVWGAELEIVLEDVETRRIQC